MERQLKIFKQFLTALNYSGDVKKLNALATQCWYKNKANYKVVWKREALSRNVSGMRRRWTKWIEGTPRSPKVERTSVAKWPQGAAASEPIGVNFNLSNAQNLQIPLSNSASKLQLKKQERNKTMFFNIDWRGLFKAILKAALPFLLGGAIGVTASGCSSLQTPRAKTFSDFAMRSDLRSSHNLRGCGLRPWLPRLRLA